jgi:hypothetical protein
MLRFSCKNGLLAGLLLMTACSQGQLPPEYSPDFVRVPVESEDGKIRRVLIPKACLKPDETADDVLGEKIPPGCANNWNLQRMAERKGDLFQGRKLSPAPAGPAVKAAEKYLEGKKPGADNPKTGVSGGGVSEGPGPSADAEAPAGPKQVSTRNR